MDGDDLAASIQTLLTFTPVFNGSSFFSFRLLQFFELVASLRDSLGGRRFFVSEFFFGD